MSSKIVHPHTVEGIFENFSARRSAIIRALTTDVDDFYGICDPKKENLCLFGHPNETWEVSLPSEEVPAELPEPALGINFARDGMNKKDWLSLVAIHSDCWLLSVAFYYAAGLNGGRRKQLFTQINKLPTVFEVIKQTNSKEKKPGVNIGKAKDGSSDNYEGNEAWCGCCRGTYSPAEFWICCDLCDTWFHGNCVKITQVEADSMSTYNCASCLEKGGQ